MNQNFNQLQVRFPGLGCWLTIFGLVWLLGAIGLGTIVKLTFALVLFLVLAPVLAFAALQFWVKRNLVEGSCPVCDQPLSGLSNLQISCPSCGTALTVIEGQFTRQTTDGVIDIQAVDVQSNTVEVTEAETAETTAQTIDVEVQRLPEADG